ncbi:MAG: extracellular solute-binding protein [Ruminococcus sp.]|nr:extracellular solute-binding protein [Ruminococcus sp.]
MDTRKITAFALAMTLAASFGSCSDTKQSGDGSDSSAAEQTSAPETELISDFTTAYRLSDYDVPISFEYISIEAELTDTNELIVSLAVNRDSEDYTFKYYRTDKALTTFTELNIADPEEAESADFHYSNYHFNTDGSMISIVTLEDHGGVKMPEKYDESFDYGSYYDDYSTSYMLAVYDKEMKLVSTAMLEYPEELYDDWGNLRSCYFIADGDSLLFSCDDGSLWRIGTDGSFRQLVPPNDDAPEYYQLGYMLYRDRDGKLIAKVPNFVEVSSENDVPYYRTEYSYCDIDENGTLSEPLYHCSDSDFMNVASITAGYGEYRLLIPEADSLIGITDSGEAKEIINWMDSDTESMSVIALGNDEFLGLKSEMGDVFSTVSVKKLTRRDPAEFANVKAVTIGAPRGRQWGVPRELINDFNSSQTEYRIKIKNIPETSDALNALGMSLIKGEAPDIIYDISTGDFFNLRNKGGFDDLYQYMDADEDYPRSAYMPNVLKAMESSDGKLYGLPASFNVDTLVTKTEVWDKQNWTFDEMLALYDDPPIPVDNIYDYDSKEEVLDFMLRPMNDLIDYDKAECHFDSPDFVKMLEFCNRFVSEVNMPDKSIDGWDANQQWWTNKFYRLKNNEALTDRLTLGGPMSSYSMEKNLNAGGADLTLAGYPSSNGKGGRLTAEYIMCINAKSKEKQGAWEFITYAADRGTKVQSYRSESGTPTLEKNFDYLLENEANMGTHSASGNEFPVLTKDEKKMLKDYILGCDTLGSDLDGDMYDICLEEAEAYFNGEISAETAAEHIQNRVSILVSERN